MEDREIINLFFSRNENAIAQTALKYGRYLRSIALHVLNNHADAEECENDTYFAAWKQIPPTWPRQLSTFLGRIVRNIALDRYDYYTAQNRNAAFDTVLSELEEVLTSPDSVEATYEEGVLAGEISNFLYRCSPVHRNLFIRRYWHTDSIAEIAVRYEMSESKIKSILFRMRKQLKKYLGEKGGKG